MLYWNANVIVVDIPTEFSLVFYMVFRHTNTGSDTRNEAFFEGIVFRLSSKIVNIIGNASIVAVYVLVYHPF